MRTFRLIAGFTIFALAVAMWVWLIRNLFRRRIRQARYFKKVNPVVFFILNLVLTWIGLKIFPDHNSILLWGLIIGLILGWTI